MNNQVSQMLAVTGLVAATPLVKLESIARLFKASVGDFD
jgi:hypothetical protein